MMRCLLSGTTWAERSGAAIFFFSSFDCVSVMGIVCLDFSERCCQDGGLPLTGVSSAG